MTTKQRTTNQPTKEDLLELLNSRVKSRVEELMVQASEFFDRDLETPVIALSNLGRRAGCASRDGKTIKFDIALLIEHLDDFMVTTIPHEVAHSIVGQICGPHSQPHGLEWTALMHLFNAPPEVTHSYDMSHCTARRQRRYTYKCNCPGGVKLSTTVHNKIHRGQVRWCRKCRKTLSRFDWVGE